MRHLEGLDALRRDALRRPVATVGVFDGMHRGHRHLLELLRAMADRRDGEAVVLTFDTHPMAVLRGAPPRRILSPAHRLALLGRLGVDVAVTLPFDERMRDTSHEAFVEEVLVGRMGIQGLLFGWNSTFGRGGLGTAATVAPLGERFGFEVVRAPAIALDGRPISSSRIRDAIQEGDLATAAAMLGRPPTLGGRVVRGLGRGRTLGFPTANVDTGGEILPPRGVYQVVLELRGRRYAAVANVGVRPTFRAPGAPADATPHLEVHVPGIDFEFYGEDVEVELVRRLREERTFRSPEALVRQIREDLASLRLP
jgi:riboflavin kinase/FMN adenylyltransferase